MDLALFLQFSYGLFGFSGLEEEVRWRWHIECIECIEYIEYINSNGPYSTGLRFQAISQSSIVTFSSYFVLCGDISWCSSLCSSFSLAVYKSFKVW